MVLAVDVVGSLLDRLRLAEAKRGGTPLDEACLAQELPVIHLLVVVLPVEVVASVDRLLADCAGPRAVRDDPAQVEVRMHEPAVPLVSPRPVAHLLVHVLAAHLARERLVGGVRLPICGNGFLLRLGDEQIARVRAPKSRYTRTCGESKTGLVICCTRNNVHSSNIGFRSLHRPQAHEMRLTVGEA